jgi:large subunit ribosomal protein L18
MDHSLKKRKKARETRVRRVRSQIRGTAEKPRLTVFKSNRHLYAQLVNDDGQMTIGGIGTQSKANQNTEFNVKSKAAARHIGKEIARIAKKHNVSAAVFDRGRYRFHGVVAELANAAREAGLQI